MINTTNLMNATTISDLVLYANEATDNVLVNLFVLAVFFIILMMLKKYDFNSALMASGFFTFIIAGVLSFIGMINIIFPLAFLAITAFSVFYAYVVQR